MSEVQGPPISLREMTILVAREELAKGVREIPAGSNRGPDVDKYLREGGGLDPEGNHFAWCSAFVCWTIIEAARRLGVTPAFKRGASVQKIRDRNPALKLDVPEVGAVWQKLNPATQAGHTGLVVAVNLEAGTMQTIEGNTSRQPGTEALDRDGDGVYARVRQISEATAGFWRIA